MTDPLTGSVILALIGMLSFMVLFMYNPGIAVSALLLTVFWAINSVQAGPELATARVVTGVVGLTTFMANLYALATLRDFTTQDIPGNTSNTETEATA